MSEPCAECGDTRVVRKTNAEEFSIIGFLNDKELAQIFAKHYKPCPACAEKGGGDE